MMAQVSAPYQPFDITLQVWRQAFQQIERLSDSFLDTAKKAAHVAFAVLLSIGSVAFDLVVSTITVIQWFTRSALLPQAPSLDPAPPPYDPKSLSFAPSAPPQQMLFSSEKMSQILQGQGNLYKKDFSKITESQFIRDALNQAFHCLEKADKASYQALIDDDGAPLQDHLTEFTDIHSWVAKCYLAHYLLYYSANPKTFLIFESMPNALRTTLQAALSIDQVKQTLGLFMGLREEQKADLVMALRDLEGFWKLDASCLNCKKALDSWITRLIQNPSFIALYKSLKTPQSKH